jgi:CRISPR/Cas system CMR-associated protein Cmr3 (group 5 of RAMP superfamily)
MIIKANGAELEISEKSGIYLGLRKKGQIFKNREELSNNTITELTKIRDKAEDLVEQAERLLSK